MLLCVFCLYVPNVSMRVCVCNFTKLKKNDLEFTVQIICHCIHYIGAVYGNGAYFAVDATMSAKYSNPDASGFRYMYRCEVLTGDYTVGRNGLNEAPIRDINTQSWYHSVVDDVTSPSMFVTFNDYQAYPEYLIIFN